MKTRALLLWALFLVAMSIGSPAQAVITCTSITSPPLFVNYVSSTTVALQTSFTTSCSRSSAGDPTSVTYFVLADNGTHAAGNQNNAALGASNLAYDFYTTACGGTKWDGFATISDTITWAAGQTGTVTRSTTFWMCMSPQIPPASGSYTDTVGLTLIYNPGSGFTFINGTVGVTIFGPAVCTIPAGGGPGNINLAYTSFSAAIVNATTTFKTQCSNGMPYTMALAPASGTLAGVNYTLALSNPNPNGTGAPQTFTITASAPAGQSGTCAGASCLQSQVHTLTVSY